MLSLFLNPWTLIAGGLLVSLPIIIHLINRIRYRRVKWAAMEFLLKAQKRMRRRKILEQLILLLLRCLLIFFAGLLFARFTGCNLDPTKGGSDTRPTTHIVILDDTPSMADASRKEDGTSTDGFRDGKDFISEKLMPAVGEATTAQTLHVIRLSNLDDPYPTKTKLQADGKDMPRTEEEIRVEARVNGKNIGAMKDYLQSLQVSTLRRSLVDGLRKAKEMFDASAGNDARVIHVVSDLRSADWIADGPTIQDLLREFKEAGIAVHLVDVGTPVRKPERKSPAFNDNVSIVELKPRNRVVSVNQQTEVEVRIKNFGNTDLKDVRVDFYLNGSADLAPASIQFQTLPANQERSQIAVATLKQGGTKEKPLDRFNILTAVIGTADKSDLAFDNSRHTVIEVRDTVKVLILDGRTLEGGIDLREKPEGDSYYLRTLFQTKSQELGNIEIVNGDYGKLDQIDLRPFTTVYLMNVPGLNDAGVANLEKFVKEGGGVGVFLGPNVKRDDYTNKMYRVTGGFFPVPLNEDPKVITVEQFALRFASFTKRLLLRNAGNKFHPALRRIYLDDRGEVMKNDGVEPYFNLVNIDAHFPVSRRGAWREDKSVQELYCLQNDDPMSKHEQNAKDLIDAIQKVYNEAKFEKARKYLDGPEGMLDRIRRATATTEGKHLAELARLLDALLCDQVNTGDESEPILRDFWTQPELVEAKKLAMLLRDETKYGDPLVIVKQFGRGRVSVMTTDAGGTYKDKKQWNDWSSLKGSPSWVVIVGEMQKYLAGGGDDVNRSVGDKLAAEFDVDRYEPVVSIHSLTADGTKVQANRTIPVTLKEVGKLTMDSPAPDANAAADAPKRPFQLKYADTKQPGAYLFTLTRKKGAALQPGATGKPDPLGDVDFLGVSVNVDALGEGDLRRANTDDLEQYTGKAPLHDPDDSRYIDSLKQKPSDLSSGRWIYLVLLLLLIAEQAWAVRISYHAKPEDLEVHAPSAAAAYSHHTTPLPTSNGEAAPVAAPSETSA